MGKRILVVDDEESVASLVADSLSELGRDYHVETASSGREALRKIASHSFDLVITDLRMPGMDGLELMERIRAGYPKTRLILMTGYGSPLVQSQATRLNVYRYITKPFQIEDLLEAAREALREKTLKRRATLVFSGERLEQIRRRLEQLLAEIGAECIFLADTMGQVVAQVGALEGADTNVLLSLIGGGFATMLELARRLEQPDALNLSYQEGEHHEVYACNLGQTLILVSFFAKATQASRIGVVWLYAKRAIRDLAPLIPAAEAGPGESDDLLEAKFSSTLGAELDVLFEDAGRAAHDEAGLAPAAETPSQPAEPPAAPPDSAAGAGPATFSLADALRLGLISPDVLEASEEGDDMT